MGTSASLRVGEGSIEQEAWTSFRTQQEPNASVRSASGKRRVAVAMVYSNWSNRKDVRRHEPGMSRIELHRHLLASKCEVPVIFITAHGSDDRARSEAASDWTVAYFIKPFSGDKLFDAADLALKWEPGFPENNSTARTSQADFISSCCHGAGSS